MSSTGVRSALIQTRTGIKAAWINDNICRFVAPRDDARSSWADEGGCLRAQIGRASRTVVVERSEEVGRPLCPLAFAFALEKEAW